jgi:hypothetical protein
MTAQALTLFDITTIPSRQLADSTLALDGERWCSGSGVPGDNCEFGHPIEAEWNDLAWRAVGDVRDASRTRAMCHRCEITRRNWNDNLDPDRTKAVAWLGKKGRKLAAIWGCSSAEARYRFELHGVTTEYITELFRGARTRGTCPDWRHGGCGERFDDGPHDITGDIKDPIEVARRGYLLCEDIHAQCATCNSSKRDRGWRKWLRICAFFHACDEYQPPGRQVPLA